MSTHQNGSEMTINDEPKPKENNAGYVSSIFNITNTIIGGGILALPFALKQAGLVLGIIFIVVQGLLVIYSSSILTKASKAIDPGVSSYNEIAKAAFGRVGPYVVEITILAFMFGALTGYIVIIGNTIKPFVYRWGWDSKIDYRLISAIIAFCIIMPVANLKTMNSLRFVSYFSIVCIAFLIISVIIKAIMNFSRNGIGKFPLVRFEMSFFRCIPIISFAFTFHPNIFPIWSELKDNSRKMIGRSIIASVFICAVSYLSIGIFGYLTFLDETTDNILINFGKDTLMDIVKIDYLVIVTFSYPMLSLPFRKTFSSLIFTSQETWWRRAIIVLWLVGFSYLLAISIPSISFVFGVVGSTAGQLVIAIYPALFYILLVDIESNEKKEVFIGYDSLESSPIGYDPFATSKKTFAQKYLTLKKVPAYLIIVYGVCFGAMGLAENIMNRPKL